MSNKGMAKGLGRGFDALIPQGFDSSILTDENERVQKLYISRIVPNADQPRKHFDEKALAELAASIKQYGVLQPLVVTPLADDTYEIIAGERRWRASRLAGLEKVPAIIRTSKELERLEIALVENVQRVDLSPLEQAASIQHLHDQFSMSYEQIAQRLSKAIPTVNNIVRLLQLPADAKQALQGGRISEGHARAILALKADPQKQQELLELIEKNHWSVRQAEQYVTAYKSGNKTVDAAKARVKSITPETERLSQLIAAPVTLRRTAKGGKLEIAFKTDEDLESIIQKLSSMLGKSGN